MTREELIAALRALAVCRHVLLVGLAVTSTVADMAQDPDVFRLR